MFVSTRELSIDVQLNGSEISVIAYSLHDSLIASIDAHYKNFAVNVFREQEGYKVSLMITMFGLIGQCDTGQRYAEEMIERIEKLQELKKQQPKSKEQQPNKE